MRLVTRTTINFLLDATLLLVFAALMWCSAVVRFVFPPGPESRGWLLWGYDYDSWAGLQFGIVCTLALGVLLHVMLHWSWVCGVVSSRLRKDKKGKVDDGVQTVYGVALLIVVFNIVGLGIAAAALSIRSSS